MDTKGKHDEHHELHPERGGPRHHDVAYDATDISARGILKFLIAIAIVGLAIHFTLWGAYRWLSRGQYDASSQPNPLVTTPKQMQQVGGDPSQKWPEPRLQPDPLMDMDKFHAREDELLNTYGYNDDARTQARIPIAEAMKQLATQGLPTRPQPAAQQGQTHGAKPATEPPAGPPAQGASKPAAGPDGHSPAVKH